MSGTKGFFLDLTPLCQPNPERFVNKQCNPHALTGGGPMWPVSRERRRPHSLARHIAGDQVGLMPQLNASATVSHDARQDGPKGGCARTRIANINTLQSISDVLPKHANGIILILGVRVAKERAPLIAHFSIHRLICPSIRDYPQPNRTRSGRSFLR